MENMESMEFYSLFLRYWGNKASMVSFSRETKTVRCVLYDSFPMMCGLNGNYGTFEGGILMSDKKVVWSYFGEELSINKDKQSILNNFQIIENYCRLRLPDKYLAKYDRSVRNK